MLVEFRLGEGAEGAEGAVDGRLLVDLDDVLAHRLVGDEELAALRARDVADVGVLLDVLRVAVAPVSGERTLVTLEELHSIVDDHLMTREHVSWTKRTMLIVIIIVNGNEYIYRS